VKIHPQLLNYRAKSETNWAGSITPVPKWQRLSSIREKSSRRSKFSCHSKLGHYFATTLWRNELHCHEAGSAKCVLGLCRLYEVHRLLYRVCGRFKRHYADAALSRLARWSVISSRSGNQSAYVILMNMHKCVASQSCACCTEIDRLHTDGVHAALEWVETFFIDRFKLGVGLILLEPRLQTFAKTPESSVRGLSLDL